MRKRGDRMKKREGGGGRRTRKQERTLIRLGWLSNTRTENTLKPCPTSSDPHSTHCGLCSYWFMQSGGGAKCQRVCYTMGNKNNKDKCKEGTQRLERLKSQCVVRIFCLLQRSVSATAPTTQSRNRRRRSTAAAAWDVQNVMLNYEWKKKIRKLPGGLVMNDKQMKLTTRHMKCICYLKCRSWRKCSSDIAKKLAIRLFTDKGV